MAMLRIRSSATAYLVAVLLLISTAKALDLRQLMRTPFASALVAAPNERRIAWVVNEAGKRNVWIADAPKWDARQATQFTADEGLEIEELAWSPDSRTLVFTRAGEFDTERQPNPTAALQSPKSMLWTVGEGSARVWTDGYSGTFSPRDGRIWFLRGGQAYSISADGSDARNEFKCEGTVSD